MLLKHEYLQVAMGRLHSVFLSSEGKAYACGHGLGGRLGLGAEVSTQVFKPQPIPVFHSAPLMDVAVGDNHTIFVDQQGTVRAKLFFRISSVVVVRYTKFLLTFSDNTSGKVNSKAAMYTEMSIGYKVIFESLLPPCCFPLFIIVLLPFPNRLHKNFSVFQAYACGDNTNGQLGLGESIKNCLEPKAVPMPRFGIDGEWKSVFYCYREIITLKTAVVSRRSKLL